MGAAAEDFAQTLRHVPGCYIDLGNGTGGACGTSLHNPHYDFNDSALPIGAAYWVQLVEHQLPASRCLDAKGPETHEAGPRGPV